MRQKPQWWSVMAFVILVTGWRASSWAAPAGSEAGEAKLRKAEELKRRYEHFYAGGKYDEALSLAAKACAILEKVLGGRSKDFAECTNDMAVICQAQGKYEKAEELYGRSLDVKKSLGPDNLDVAATLNNLASLYHYQGEYEKAEPLYERALTIREEVQGPEHPDVGQSLNNLAALYWAQGDYERARPICERALTIREETQGPEHPDVAQSLNNLASIYMAQGFYRKAEPLYERALTIREKALGTDHPDVAFSVGGLAELYVRIGEYGKAEPLYERALVVREKALGSEHPGVAQSLNNLALLYEDQGEFKKAETMYERALAIREKTLGLEHPDVAQTLNNLAGLYLAQGEYGKAELMDKRSLAILEKTLGPDHPTVAFSLNNLAVLYRAKREYEKAESLSERALRGMEVSLGPEHPSVASGLNNLAELYQRRGEYGKAESLYERALVIREKVLGPEHLLVALSLGNLGLLYLDLGRYDLAAKLRGRALDIEYEQLNRVLLFAEEHRRIGFALKMSSSLHNAVSAHLQAVPNHQPTAELALTALLRRKGLVRDLGTRSAATIRRSLPEEDQYLLDELSASRDEYAALSDRGPGPNSIDAYAEALANIQRKQHLLWRRLTELSPVVDTLTKPIAVVDIQRELGPDAVLVEFVRYRPLDREETPSASSGPRYAAYLVFCDRFDWVDLGPAEPIEGYVKAFRRTLQLKQTITTELYDAVMQPIVDRLGDAHRMFIAPDGDLSLLPFGAIFDGDHYLLERYELHYLTSGRDLLRPWDVYGSSDDDVVMVVANPAGAGLPGTEYEAELLDGLFSHVEILLHDEATAAGAQRRAQPWLLHMATHGFFEIPEQNPDLGHEMDEYIRSMSPSSLPFAPGRLDNPMLHSGLLLASSVNPADTTVEPGEQFSPDGRLTAYEISGWDLRGTELVVLSACGTGLGEPRAGEGVLGLRRAFAMAGAQTQVMSLWDVSDATTAKLMDAYYRKLLAGKGRAEAMQETQLEMLGSGEHHPGDWASFVVLGEWRPLSMERLLALPEGPPPVELGGCDCQRASVAGEDRPPGKLVLALLSLLAILRRRRVSCPMGPSSSN